MVERTGEGHVEDRGEAPVEAVRLGLAWKVFLLTFPFVAIVVLLTQLWIGWTTYQDQLTQLETRARVMAQLAAEGVSRPLWNFDREIVAAQVRALGADFSFRHARLFDDRGAVVVESGTPPRDSRFVRVESTVVEPTQRRPIGRLELVLTTDELRATGERLLTIGIAAFLTLLVGFSLAAHLSVRWLVTRPLGGLLAAMARVERKDWATVPWVSRDEVGAACRAFNRMVARLRSGDEAQRLLAELRAAQREILRKNEELERANHLIIESLRYARTIQEGMLPDPRALDGTMAELALLWEPLQVVGGDYVWLERRGSLGIVFVADCTGHGVPGAFMTLVAAAALERILDVEEVTSPAAILGRLDELVRARLRQDGPQGSSDDGLDAAVCVYDGATGILRYAGANVPLLLLQGGVAREIRAGRASLGYRSHPPRGRLVEHELEVAPGDRFYLFTDGVPDHMGGRPRRLFGRRRLARLVADTADVPLGEQVERIKSALEDYRGDERRRDDVALIAFRPL